MPGASNGVALLAGALADRTNYNEKKKKYKTQMAYNNFINDGDGKQ